MVSIQVIIEYNDKDFYILKKLTQEEQWIRT